MAAHNPPPAAIINVPAGQNLQQVLNDHDRAKRSTDIPLFYGQPARDTIAACLLIVRVNDAGEIASWNDNHKLLEFKMCLRDKAVGWFKGLMEEGVDTNDFATVKTEFLETYEPKYSTKTTCANFTDLNQKSEETINDYTYCVQIAYKCLTDKKPATMAAVRARAAAADIKAEGINDAFKFKKHQLFLASLKDGIRNKVLEAAKDTFTESVKVTRNLETIPNDHKRLNRINAIKQELQEERAKEIMWDNLSDQELNQLAVIHYTRSQYNNRSNNSNQARSSTAVRNPNTACRYCQKKGYLQKDCFARKRDKAPMVDATGKPYQNQSQNNRVNNVAGQPAAAAAAQPASEAGYEDAFIGSVANLSPYHHLNW
jgi:Retrotransposon gag protein